MSLTTHSRFYYGFLVTTESKYLPFDEGSGELLAEVKVGAFTAEEMATEIGVRSIQRAITTTP
jgi:hypothetical protein